MDLDPVAFRSIVVFDLSTETERRTIVYYRRGAYAVVPWRNASWRAHPSHCQLVHTPTHVPMLGSAVSSDLAIKLAHLGADLDPYKHDRLACMPFLQALTDAGGPMWDCKTCGIRTYRKPAWKK